MERPASLTPPRCRAGCSPPGAYTIPHHFSSAVCTQRANVAGEKPSAGTYPCRQWAWLPTYGSPAAFVREQMYETPLYVPCAPTGAQNAPGRMLGTVVVVGGAEVVVGAAVVEGVGGDPPPPSAVV